MVIVGDLSMEKDCISNEIDIFAKDYRSGCPWPKENIRSCNFVRPTLVILAFLRVGPLFLFCVGSLVQARVI